MRPAQCRTLVFAICLMSILKGLKKPPPAAQCMPLTVPGSASDHHRIPTIY